MKNKMLRLFPVLVALAVVLPNASYAASRSGPAYASSRDSAPAAAPTAVSPIINVLQIYPDGHNTTVVAQAIYSWSTLFHIDVVPVTTFNACASVACVVAVSDPISGTSSMHPISYYDVLYFGVADVYGGYDLSPDSAKVVREFSQLGRGLVFTHDTVARGVNNSGMAHPNFASLTDVHGIGLVDTCPWLTFTNVKLVSDQTTNPVLNSPLRIPESFEVLNTHWGCQKVISGTAWYNGTDAGNTADYNLYMQTYFNDAYGSRSSFYSFGHTESAPLEWEAKAMINSMYFSYRGSGPLLELPFDYAYTNFASAAQGRTGRITGRVNSWFDHNLPNYGKDHEITTWQGNSISYPAGPVTNPDKYCDLGTSCYAGHNGIDFSRYRPLTETEPIYAAAPGVVTKIVTDCLGKGTDCGDKFGNQVWIDHGMGYTTLYGHLETVYVMTGTKITNIALQPIGLMGSTGNSTGPHLHFGLYHNNVAVDPYGWVVTKPDPWTRATSLYLWKHSLWTQQSFGKSGGTLASPSGNVQMIIPAGALASTATLELWDTPPIAHPSAQLSSIGQSFWLRVLEWLPGNGTNGVALSASTSFAQPLTVTVAYTDSEMLHLDKDRLGVYRWSANDMAWVGLTTTLQANQNQVMAQTNEIGNFDLQAPLLCPADTSEPDDGVYVAKPIPTNGEPVNDLFDVAQDEDWFQLEAQAGNKYLVQTPNLAAGVNPIVEVYTVEGVTLLNSNNDSGSGRTSKLEWQAPQDGPYFIRLSRGSGSAYGCNATYQISVTEFHQLYLPLAVRK